MMSESVGFYDDGEEDNIIDDEADISGIQPEFEEGFFQDNYNENELGIIRDNINLPKLGQPFLGKLAKARLIAARSGQLQLGSPPLIPINQLYSFELHEIAIQEFNEAVEGRIIFPIKIIRKFADGTYEVWRISDFEYFVRDKGRSQRSCQRPPRNIPSQQPPPSGGNSGMMIGY